ncbi:MAG: cytidine deaminase [Candidatus Brocadiia bacterium]
MEYKSLITSARTALKRAYAPYSKFKVGAAILARNNRIFTGCNIENASYGLTVCAERAAVFNAVSAGIRDFKVITVVTNGKTIAYPCGACLQVLSEFSPNITIVLVSGNKQPIVKPLGELLVTPFRFHRD